MNSEDAPEPVPQDPSYEETGLEESQASMHVSDDVELENQEEIEAKYGQMMDPDNVFFTCFHYYNPIEGYETGHV